MFLSIILSFFSTYRRSCTLGRAAALLIIAGLCLPSTLPAQAQPMTLSRIEGEITLDGYPDEEAWKQLDPLPFTMYMPRSGATPTERSDVRIGYTDDYIYVGVRLYDSQPSKIQSTTMQRDWADPSHDYFGLILDTFNNNETALAFFVEPSGARSDFNVYNDAQGDFPLNMDWNTFWDVEVQLNDRGWFIEMRIPFSSLRFQTDDKQVVMGLIVNRWIARKNEGVVFPAIPNNWGFWGQFKPSRSREVRFRKIENKNPLYISPYLLGGGEQNHALNEAGTSYLRNDELTYDAGLDIKYGLSSSLTLDLTVNTDFAQVEADNQQVNLTRFSLFFPEKRQFFQERSSLFDVSMGGPNRLFYSRRIGINDGQEVRILGGARLTGSFGDWDLGVINMQTARENNIQAENFGVLRLRRQVFNPNSYIGTLFTSRIGMEGRYNYAYGIDGLINLFDDNYLNANFAQTFSDTTSSPFNSLDPARIRLEWETRSLDGFGYSLSYSRSGRDYHPGIGFEVREDYTRWGNNISYGWYSDDDSPFINQQLRLAGSIFLRNKDGTTQSGDIGPQWQANWKSGSNLQAGPKLYYEDIRDSFEILPDISIPAGSYYYYGFEGNYNTPESALFIGRTSVTAGEFFDGYRLSGNITLSWSLSPNLKISPFYEISRIGFPERDRDFTVHLGRFGVEYYFNTEWSINSFVQYNNTSQTVISNFRLRFNPREGNDLYIVYNENLNTDRFGFNPVKPLSNFRTLLIKYTHTLVY